MEQEVARISAAYAVEWWRTAPMFEWSAPCCLRFRCALGFVEDPDHCRTGSTTITCPNPATHSGRQHITVGPLAALIGITLNASSPEDRGIVTARALQAQTLFPEGTTAQDVVDVTRVATTRGDGERGRGRALCVRSATAHTHAMWGV